MKKNFVIITMPDGSTFGLEMSDREVKALMSLTWNNDYNQTLVEEYLATKRTEAFNIA